MHVIDYIIVLLSILAAIGTGVYFAHKQKDTRFLPGQWASRYSPR